MPGLHAFLRGWWRRTVRPSRRLDESGVTMVEMMVAMLTLAILLAISVPVVMTLTRTTSRVDVTYTNVDQQLWLSTNLQRLVRAAVAPQPSFSGHAPIPAFVPGTITPTSMSFHSNTGTANGPVLVHASCDVTSSNHTLCAAPTATFTVEITAPVAGTCPRTTNPTTVNPTTRCTYTPAKGAKSHDLVQVTHVKNGANGKPLFVYAYGPEPTPGRPMTTTTVCALHPTPTHSGCTAATTDSTVFGTAKCLAATPFTSLKPFTNCPAGEIETVDYDLQINANTSTLNGGSQAEDDTGVFVLSSTSMLFDPTVG
ncbi:MAG: type II secretion system protein [Acidimicrobiales bacterium]